MNWRHIISGILLGTLLGRHAPLLLTKLSPETKPKTNYKYYQPDFHLDQNSVLRTDGYYYFIGSPRPVTLTVKSYEEAKKNEISPFGFDIGKMNITSDTVLTVIHTNVYVFYPNGTYIQTTYGNKLRQEVSTDVENKFRQMPEGWDVYKIEGNKIRFEYYTQISGFKYNDGIIGNNTITVGKSQPYQFIPFQN